MSYSEDAAAERDEQEYAGFLSDYGIPHVCLTCGARQTVDPHSPDYQKFNVLCACGKHCLPEDEITPDLAGILLCRRAGANAFNLAKDDKGHERHYERVTDSPLCASALSILSASPAR